jgi:hypothetical protein
MTPCKPEHTILEQILKAQRSTIMENMNRTAEATQEQEVIARKPWQTPVVEELLMNQAEASLVGGHTDLGIYS